MRIWSELEPDRKFGAIDVCKLVMAFVVIAIHTNPIVEISNPFIVRLVIIIEEFAVPFFFVTSGFFLYMGMKSVEAHEEKRIKEYLFRLIRMYCVWTLISLPLTIYGYYISGDGLIHCLLSYIKYFLFVGKLYNSYHLWYLLALIYAVVVIWILIKKNVSLYKMAILGLILFLFNEMILWFGTVENIPRLLYSFSNMYQFIFNKGGIFTGMVYVCIGMLIAERKIYLKYEYCLVGLIGINAIQIVSGEAAYWNIILELIENVLFFMLILNIKLSERNYYVKCRKASTVIYLSHLMFFSIYTILVIDNPNKLGLDSFCVTAILSSMCSWVLIKVSDKDKFRWIKKFI